MRVVCQEQRTPEWHAARRGVITASRIRDVLAGKATKARTGYLLQMALDREGVPNFAEEDDPPWFRHGAENEALAIGWYAMQTGSRVESVGFCLHGKHDFLGCSPDGWVIEQGDEYGLVEAKCRRSLRSYKKAIDRDGPEPAYADQIQCQLLVTGCEWCDYLNYLPPYKDLQEKGDIKRVYRDAARIEYIEERVLAFQAEVLKLLAARQPYRAVG